MGIEKKRSFFDRLTSAVNMDDTGEHEEEIAIHSDEHVHAGSSYVEEEASIGELAVDVHENADSIVIKAFAAGVRPEDLDVAITRDQVTIHGKRTEDTSTTQDDFHIRELYWGEFTRTIALPAEIEADEAEAQERHGLLIIKLPKIDKGRQTKLRVKAI